MDELIKLLFSVALISNLTLTYLIGLDVQIAASQRIEAAWLVGLSTIYCLGLCLPGVYLIDRLLIIPLQLHHLDLLFYILFILIIVSGSQKLSYRFFPLIHKQVAAVVPIILMNSILLAAILLRQHHVTPPAGNTFFGSFVLGICMGLGLLFLLLVLTCLRERINNENVPATFQGLPILLITLGIFSMGLMGLARLQ